MMPGITDLVREALLLLSGFGALCLYWVLVYYDVSLWYLWPLTVYAGVVAGWLLAQHR